jgi:hypothetical protein
MLSCVEIESDEKKALIVYTTKQDFIEGHRAA